MRYNVPGMRPYARMNSENTALLVVDVINSCAHEKCEVPKWEIRFSRIRQMVPRLEKFIEEYRKVVGGLVIFGKTVPWRKEFLPENLRELYEDPAACYYSEDSSGFADRLGPFREEFYQVAPQEGDVVVTKNTYDAFADPKFIEVLEQRGIRYVLITGVFGDGCILASICGGFSRGYNLVILKDLIETSDVPIRSLKGPNRQELLARLKEYTFPYMYGRTPTAAQFLANWN